MASDDKWVIAESDDEFLTRQGANKRERALAAGILDGVSPARIGEVAGYGAGRSSDPEKRRQNWSAAVSRAAKRGGQVVTRIQALIDALRHFRQHGEGPKVAAELEVLEKLSTVIRGSSDAHVISDGKALLESYRRGLVQTKVTVKDFVATFVANVGAERTRRGFEELGAGHLIYAAPDLFLEQKTLEYDNEQRSDERRAGDDSRNFNSRGLRGVSDDAAGKMDRGSGIAGGAGAGQRSVSSRDIEGRLSELEKLELKKLQEARP